MIIYANTLIVYGGTAYPFGQQTSNAIYLCNLKTLVWKRLETHGEPPLGLYGSSLILKDHYLYILFGTKSSAEFSSNVYQVNLNTLESKHVFNSTNLLNTGNFIQQQQIAQQYPDSFLTGRYIKSCFKRNHYFIDYS